MTILPIKQSNLIWKDILSGELESECKPLLKWKSFSSTFFLEAFFQSSQQGSISPTFSSQLLRQQVYADLTSAQRRAFSIEVECIFQLGAMVKLGVILLVKLNGAYWCQRMLTGTFELCTIRLVKLTPDVIGG